MDYADVKEWLDILVDRYKKANETSYLTPRIYAAASTENNVLIYEGLEIVADIMGLELTEKYLHSDVFDEDYYRYSFVYEGVEFVTSQKERLESFARRD